MSVLTANQSFYCFHKFTWKPANRTEIVQPERKASSTSFKALTHLMVRACNPPPSNTFPTTEHSYSNQLIAAMMNKNSHRAEAPTNLSFHFFSHISQQLMMHHVPFLLMFKHSAHSKVADNWNKVTIHAP